MRGLHQHVYTPGEELTEGFLAWFSTMVPDVTSGDCQVLQGGGVKFYSIRKAADTDDESVDPTKVQGLGPKYLYNLVATVRRTRH